MSNTNSRPNIRQIPRPNTAEWSQPMAFHPVRRTTNRHSTILCCPASTGRKRNSRCNQSSSLLPTFAKIIIAGSFDTNYRKAHSAYQPTTKRVCNSTLLASVWQKTVSSSPYTRLSMQLSILNYPLCFSSKVVASRLTPMETSMGRAWSRHRV